MFADRRPVVRAGSVAVLSVLLASLAAAADKPSKDKPSKDRPSTTDNPDPSGMWSKYQVGQRARFVIWHDAQGWNVRTTTAKTAHEFHGSITVEGGTFTGFKNFVSVDQRVKRSGAVKGPDRGALNAARNQLLFRFKTNTGEDGFTFTVSPTAKNLHFELTIDGSPDNDLIFIGKNGDHPTSNKFKLPANP